MSMQGKIRNREVLIIQLSYKRFQIIPRGTRILKGPQAAYDDSTGSHAAQRDSEACLQLSPGERPVHTAGAARPRLGEDGDRHVFLDLHPSFFSEPLGIS